MLFKLTRGEIRERRTCSGSCSPFETYPCRSWKCAQLWTFLRLGICKRVCLHYINSLSRQLCKKEGKTSEEKTFYFPARKRGGKGAQREESPLFACINFCVSREITIKAFFLRRLFKRYICWRDVNEKEKKREKWVCWGSFPSRPKAGNLARDVSFSKTSFFVFSLSPAILSNSFFFLPFSIVKQTLRVCFCIILC